VEQVSTIPLAKGYTPNKLNFPVYVSRKVDGVPVLIDINEHGNWTTRTRQGKPMPSVHSMVQEFVDDWMADGGLVPISLVGEVYQRGNMDAPFKDTSGMVRNVSYDQSSRLSIAIFDCSEPAGEGFGWRYENVLNCIPEGRVSRIAQVRVDTLEELEAHWDAFEKLFPTAEGLVARSHDDPWAPGKRSWGYQKLLRDPTIDLWIVGAEQATSEAGDPLGMVGRLIAEYKGEQIGIGPGKLTHDERRDLWYKLNYAKPMISDGLMTYRRMAQIKYKADDSYTALRQPTFQCWRDDKDTPDA
jgi:ATP-dependent DNA ligase